MRSFRSNLTNFRLCDSNGIWCAFIRLDQDGIGTAGALSGDGQFDKWLASRRRWILWDSRRFVVADTTTHELKPVAALVAPQRGRRRRGRIGLDVARPRHAWKA